MNITNDQLYKLSESYKVPFTDTLLIALNVNGINSDLPHKRIRFKLKPYSYCLPFYFGLPNNIVNSPFKIVKNSLFLGKEKVGDVSSAEDDTCDAVYLRNNSRVLCFNSHSRSMCRGCKFCFELQTSKDRETVKTRTDVENCFVNLEKRYGEEFFANLEEIALVTGCFNDSDKLINHLNDIYECAVRKQFRGDIYYLGTEIASYKQLYNVSHMRFRYTYAVENISRRKEMLRNSKSQYTIKNILNIMENAKALGIIVAYSYIVGLEQLQDNDREINALNQIITGFPVYNIFQAHTVLDQTLRCNSASDLRYYIEARKYFEENIYNESIYPRRWQNYRSLWYTTYKGIELNDETI